MRRTRPKARRPTNGAVALGEINLRLPYREPFPVRPLFEFLAQRAVDGVESWDGHEYRRTVALPHGGAVLALSEGTSPGPGYLRCRLRLSDLRDLGTAVERARRLLDLDADPVAVAQHLGEDPLLAPAVARHPGRRIPGSVDGAELALRAVLGQQVTVAGGRRMASRLTAQWGSDVASGPGPAPSFGPMGAAPTRLFPTPAVLAALDPTALGMPLARGRAFVGLAQALADRRIAIDAGADRQAVPRQLVALAGIGPWTAAYVALRGLGDPDAFLASDLGVRRALERAGLAGGPAAAVRRAERWRPWRGYALQYLWAA